MDASTLIESFADFAKQKNIDRPTMIRILEDVFRNMIRKKYGTDDNFDIIINADKGDLEIYRIREIVDDDSGEKFGTAFSLELELTSHTLNAVAHIAHIKRARGNFIRHWRILSGRMDFRQASFI